MSNEFNRIKTDYEQLQMHNHEELNQEITQLRQTNDENQKNLEEFQLINKTLESTIQNKTNEFNHKVNVIQHELDEVKQKNQDLLNTIDQLKTINSTNDTKLIESNDAITDLKHANEELQDRIQALTTERNEIQITTQTTTERIKQIEHAKQSAEERFKELENEKSLINNKLENEKLEFEKQIQDANLDRQDLLDRNREHEESLIDLVHEKEELEHKISELETATREWATKYVNITDNQKSVQTNYTNMMNNLKQQYKYSILTFCINQMHDGVERTKDIDLLNCKSGAEYLLSKLRMAVASAKTTQDLWKKQLTEDESTFPFLNECITLSNSMVDIVVHGKATSNLIQDVDQSVLVADNCRDATLQCIDLYSNYQASSTDTDFDKQSNDLIRRLNSLIDKTTTLLPKVSDISKEELGDLVEKELQLTHETIDEAVRQLEAMMAKSREQDTGIKCEVNGQILDSCGKLMQTIKVLINKARDLQKEIVGQGRGTASAREFYTKNHKWTEGLVSAAKNVGVNAKVLIESADHLLGGTGKFEEIIACSQEIAAATAQLVAASNVKADRESKNREALSQASKAVNSSTAQVVATAKNCAAIIEEKSAMDFSSLSLHQTKRKEMDAQVKVLELEKALEQAKKQLYTLRKQHYQMAGEDAGWDQNVIEPIFYFNIAYDIAIYGATLAGISAAITAARVSPSFSIVIIEPTAYIGGMSTAGGIGLRDLGLEITSELVRFSGASFTWSRESRNQYNESLAGVQPYITFANFIPNYPVNATLDNETLAPYISPIKLGLVGSADLNMMGYSYRLWQYPSDDKFDMCDSFGSAFTSDAINLNQNYINGTVEDRIHIAQNVSDYGL
ncbi:unnamed protein product [Adineta steineri]|uniref:I/LWEQ domain-containing protein n=1 Tax=Adineta steineri TaxID=433720 RepID=A0A814T5F1_9BILA|nr:unnamed protein product [Adineta steineri]